MTELVIGGRRVVLPKSLSFTLIEENAEITSAGEYTWDISVSLKNKINAVIFKNIYRLNVSTVDVTCDATLIIDNSVRNGKIIIQSNTDAEVKFQFVAGNSELNYNAKSDTRKIYELDWGTESAIDFAQALQTLSYPGYGTFSGVKNNFVCTPVKIGDQIANDFNLEMTSIGDQIIMQPYLLYYINKLPELLGFKLINNVLESDSRAKKMFLVNAVNSLNYSDALPDMTVSEFIDAIEFFFNVSLIVNTRDKSLSIERMYSTLQNKKKITVTNVLDSYVRDLSQDSQSTRFDYTRVKYDLPGSNYFKYHCLSDDIIAKCKIIYYDNPYVFDSANENKLVIYRENTTKEDYFTRHAIYNGTGIPFINLLTFGQGDTLYSLVNKFAPFGDSDDRVLTLKIIPAAMSLKSVIIPAGTGTATTYWQMPVSSNSYFIPSEVGFMDLVEKGSSDISRTSNLEVSLYTGLMRIPKSYTSTGQVTATNYPISQNDNTPEDYFYVTGQSLDPETLRIVGPGGIVSNYKIQNILDTTKEYTFTIFDTPGISANSIFSIRNKDYMPISLEHEVEITGFGKKVTGKFYAFK